MSLEGRVDQLEDAVRELHGRVERCGDLPFFVGAPDVQRLFGGSLRTAQRRLASGELGPFTRIGNGFFIERDDFLRAIKRARVIPARRR